MTTIEWGATEKFVGGLEVDHIIPKSAGGTSEESNLWVACRRCNRARGEKTQAIDPETK